MTSHLEKSTTLVVGGAGFVGGNLVRLLLDSGVQHVTVVDNFLSSERSNLPNDPRLILIEGSISDDSTLQKIPEGLDFVWHLACFHGNQSSIADPLSDHANNLLTSLKLFHYLSMKQNPKKVVYAAAGCAVAEKTFAAPAATSEDAPVTMFHDSPYSISKIVGELYGNYFFKRTGLNFVKARFQNVYGPGEVLGAGKWRGTPATVWRNVIPTFVWRALQNMTLRLDHHGQVGRDFIHVRDVCRGLVLCALEGEPGESYNLASGRETLIINLAQLIRKETGSSSQLELVGSRDWDASGRRFGATEKSRLRLGFNSEISLEDGIAETVQWTRDNSTLIKTCINRHQDKMRDCVES